MIIHIFYYLSKSKHCNISYSVYILLTEGFYLGLVPVLPLSGRRYDSPCWRCWPGQIHGGGCCRRWLPRCCQQCLNNLVFGHSDITIPSLANLSMNFKHKIMLELSEFLPFDCRSTYHTTDFHRWLYRIHV